MIDLTKTAPYEMAIRSQRFLKDSLVWFDTFSNNPVLINKILDWIRLGQLKSEGEDADGDIIGYYSLLTSLINPEKEFNSPFTLDDTGRFYASMYVRVLADELYIDATDTEKMEDQDWWDERIVALNEENRENLKNAYKENVINYARAVLFRGR